MESFTFILKIWRTGFRIKERFPPFPHRIAGKGSGNAQRNLADSGDDAGGAGAYYLTELASQVSAKRKTLKNAVVLLCVQDAEQMWAAVLDARAKLPDAALVVLSPKAAGAQPLEPSMRGVTFASPATVGAEVCRLLAVPQRE